MGKNNLSEKSQTRWIAVGTIVACVLVSGCGSSKTVTRTVAPTTASPNGGALSPSAAATVGAALRDITTYCSAADKIANDSFKHGLTIEGEALRLGLGVSSDVDRLIAVYRASPSSRYVDARGSRTMRQVLADAGGTIDPSSCTDATAALMAKEASAPALVNAGVSQPPAPGQALPPAKDAAALHARLQTELQATP